MIQNPTRNTTDSIRCTGVALRPLATIMATDGLSPWSVVGHVVVGAGAAAASMLVQFHDGANRTCTIYVNSTTRQFVAQMRNAAGTANAKSVTFTDAIEGKTVCFAAIWRGDGSGWEIRAAVPGESLADTTGSTAAPYAAVAGVSLFDPIDTTINGNGAEGHIQVHVLKIALSAEQFAAARDQWNAGAWVRNHLADMVWACDHALASIDGAMPGSLPTAANLRVFHDADNDGVTTDEALDAIPASGVVVNGTGLRYSRPTEASGGTLVLRTQAQIGTGAHTVPTSPVPGRSPALRRLADGAPRIGGDRIAIVSNSRGNLQQEDTEDPPTGGAGHQVNYAAGFVKQYIASHAIGVGNYQPRLSGANGFLLDYTTAASAGAAFHTGADNGPWDDWCRFGSNSSAGTSSTDATGPGMFARISNSANTNHARWIIDPMGLVEATTPVTIRVLMLAHPNAPLAPIAVQRWDGSTYLGIDHSLNTEVGATTVVSYTGGSTTIVLTGDHRAAILAGDLLCIEVSAGAWAPAMVASVSGTLSEGNTVVTLAVACNHKTTSTGRTIPTAGNAVRYGPWEWRWGTVTLAGAEAEKGLRILMPGGADSTAQVLVYAVEAWAHTLAGIVAMPMGWGGHGYSLQVGGTWGAYTTVSARTGHSPVSAFLAAMELDCLIVTAAEQGSSPSSTQLVLTEMARAYGDWTRRTVLATGPAMPATTSPTRWGFADSTAEWAAWQAANAGALGLPWLSAYAACGDAIDFWADGSAHNNAHISAEGNRRTVAAWMAQAGGAVHSAGAIPRGRSRHRKGVAINSGRSP